MRAVFRSRLGWLGAIVVLGLGAGMWSPIGAARAGPPPDRLELPRPLQEPNFDRLEIRFVTRAPYGDSFAATQRPPPTKRPSWRWASRGRSSGGTLHAGRRSSTI